MAPISRASHLFGMGAFAVLYGVRRTALLFVVSGVYYPVTVLPDWMQWLSVISPATYTLEGCRKAILHGASISEVWPDIWPLLVIGVVAVPLGLAVFRRGERFAK